MSKGLNKLWSVPLGPTPIPTAPVAGVLLLIWTVATYVQKQHAVVANKNHDSHGLRSTTGRSSSCELVTFHPVLVAVARSRS